jgi:hypothetical protein
VSPRLCIPCVALLAALGWVACDQGPATPTPQATTPPLESSGAPAEIRASVDRAQATTGDIITYTVDVDHAATIVVDVQEPGASIAGLRILDVGRDAPVNMGTRVREKRWYKLRADLVGSYVLPPVQAMFRNPKNPAEPAQTLQSSEIFIEVKSVLPTDGEVGDIQDIEPLEVVHKQLRWGWIAATAAALVAILVGLFWWWRKNKQTLGATPALPPHEQAFRALNALRKTDFANLEAVRAYYFAISEVIRIYVEGRFEFNATDLTTEEIFARLADISMLQAAQRQSLRNFLSETDTVKYAARVPDNAHIAHTYEQALSFVEATQPAKSPPDATATATPA